MNTKLPDHLMTLANARNYIGKLEREISHLKTENARLRPQSAKPKKEEKPNNQMATNPIPFISRSTPESTQLYRERIEAARDFVEKTKRDYSKARTLEEQNRAIELHKKAKKDLDAAYLDYSGVEWEKSN